MDWVIFQSDANTSYKSLAVEWNMSVRHIVSAAASKRLESQLYLSPDMKLLLCGTSQKFVSVYLIMWSFANAWLYVTWKYSSSII